MFTMVSHLPPVELARTVNSVQRSRRRDAPGHPRDVPARSGERPLFPFGHGLSYTKLEYGPLSVDGEEVRPDGTVTARIAVTSHTAAPFARSLLP